MEDESIYGSQHRNNTRKILSVKNNGFSKEIHYMRKQIGFNQSSSQVRLSRPIFQIVQGYSKLCLSNRKRNQKVKKGLARIALKTEITQILILLKKASTIFCRVKRKITVSFFLSNHQKKIGMMTDLGLSQHISANCFTQASKAKQSQQAFNGSLKMKAQMQLNLRQQNKFSAHLDSVKQMYKSENGNFLATVSQDCLIKIWNFKEAITNSQIQPAVCLRQHTGPLFCISGGKNPFMSDEQLLFTGGSEGCVKMWKIEDTYQLQKTSLIGNWNNSRSEDYDQHAVWQLSFRNSNSKLLSSSSDGVVRLFRLQQTAQAPNQITGVQERTFKEKNFMQTALSWATDNSFFVGCSNAPRANLWDLQGKISQKFLFESEKNKEPHLSQINCLDYLNVKKILCLGCEDSHLRIFDLNSGRIIKRLKVHSSVSCLTTLSEWQIANGCQDGSMRIWDLRVMETVFEDRESCLKKYDQGVQDIVIEKKTVLISGSDGTIKVYS